MGPRMLPRRLATVAAAVTLAVACNGDGGDGPAASPTPDPTQRPAAWVGLKQADNAIILARAEGGEPQDVASRPRSGPDAGTPRVDAEDVAWDAAAGRAYAALCCEPVSGSIWSVETRASDPSFEPAEGLVGFRVDARTAEPATVVTVGTTGALGITVAGRPQTFEAVAGVTDAAVRASGRVRVAVVVDPARVQAMTGSTTTPDPSATHGVVVFERSDQGAWSQIASADAPEGTHYCQVVWLGAERVGLLSGDLVPGDPFSCVAHSVDTYHLDLNRFDLGEFVFDEPVRHIGVDDSGFNAIYTTARGGVGWIAQDGAMGVLTESGFVAADW